MTEIFTSGVGSGVAPGIQLLPTGDAAPVSVDVVVSSHYYLAAAHRSPVRGLVVTNNTLEPAEGADELVVTCEVESALAQPLLEPRAVAIPLPPAGLTLPFQRFRLEPNRRTLALLEERLPAELVVTVRRLDEVVGYTREPIEFLAHNQWMFAPGYFDSLAAFVQPNSPIIDRVIVRARQLLSERTGSGSTEGYQCLPGDPQRVHQMAEAVFDALAESRLEYSDPPAGFEGHGQKVRTPDVVLAESAATCLDSAVLYVSCLLRIGLRAQIVVISGHALASYWVTERPHHEMAAALRESVMKDRNAFDQLLTDGVLRLVETTDFTLAHDRSFATACRSGEQRCMPPAKLLALVDVQGCIAGGVVPLPPRELVHSGSDLSPVEVERWTAPEDDPAEAVPTGTDGSGRGERLERAVRPPRVEAWLRSLLDLSYANPLIRMKTSTRAPSAVELKLPRGVAAAAEDRLMASGSLVIQPGSAAPSSLLQDPDDSDAYLTELRRSGVLFYPSPAQFQTAEQDLVRQWRADHPEEPTGRVAVDAAAAIDDAYRRLLDKVMRGLKRRANDLERQTGSNNLFLSVGQLQWTGDDKKTGAAPLFLIPVRISGSAKQGYAITPDESAEVMPNYALMEKLRQTYQLSIDALERPITDDAGIDVGKLLSGVRSALTGERIRDAVVVESMTLAVLDFSSFRLWRDLNDHWETFLASPVLHHLVHTPSADFVDQTTTPESESPEPLCPIEADESQMEAVRAAVAGKTFVLEGPPGTGKSQTITNLLAASIAAGKKVLFVAEKSAALEVVRKRLDSVGLGPLCLELFDKEAKPDHIKAQIQAALDLQPPDRQTEWDEIVERLHADERRLDGYRDAIHQVGPNGRSLWAAYQEVARLGSGPDAPLPEGFIERLPSYEDAVRSALLDLPRVVGSPSVDRANAWSLCAQQDFASINGPSVSWAVQMLAWARSVLRAQPPELVAILDSVVDPAEFNDAADVLEQAANGTGLRADEIEVISSPGWVTARNSALGLAASFHEAVRPALEVFRPSVLIDDLSAVVGLGQAALTAGALSRSKATRNFHAGVLPYLLNPGSEVPVASLMALLHQVPDLRAQWSSAHHAVVSLAGLRLRADWSLLDPESMGEVRAQLDVLPQTAAAARAPIPQLVLGQAGGLAAAPQLIEALRGAARGWATMLNELNVDSASAHRWSAGRSLWQTWGSAEHAWSSDGERLLHLQRWCDTLSALQPLRNAGLDHFADTILTGDVPLDDAATWFQRGVARAVLDERTLTAGLDRFDGHAHDRVVDDFADRFRQRRELMIDQIPSELVARRPVPAGKRIGKWGELERHLAAQRRKISIRRLIEDYGPFVGDLTPCFLMSPDSVARFIPPGSITFDLVVFDEASQIEVPRGAGALGRARAAVIVGDTKQMPPSRFGGTRQDDDADSDGTELVVSDLESLLEECRESRLPSFTLQCHYRSRHEALIAFSNHHFYEDQLTTFPSPAASGDAPIGWRRIDGRFRRRATKLPDGWDEQRDPWSVGTNLIEARAVVAEIVARLSDPARSTDSIGVVTSNQPQRELIRDLLLALGDPNVTQLLERDDDQSLLVQNLENVQGDERDVILMSIGFSPEVTVAEDGTPRRGRLPMNFGPLNQQGGERRLNVAVTRARAEMVIFCSFDPEEMSVGADSPRGIQLLHAYLSAARDGVTRSGDVVGRFPSAHDRHRAQIATELRARGYLVQEDVGLSRFRVDLAVAVPGDDGYRVAILLDGPAWAARSMVHDRDVLPRSVLSGLMGWSEVIRLWLPMWLHARDEVLDEIDAAVTRATAGAQRPDPPAAVTPAGPPPIPAGLAIPEVVVDLPPPEVNEDPPTVPLATAAAPLAPVRSSGPDESDPGHDIFGPDVPVFGFSVDLGELGSTDVLDDLPAPAARQAVHRAIVETVDALAPIERDELCKLIARRFGLSRVRADRVASIAALVPAAWVRTGNLGCFVWPPNLDPDSWDGFRRNVNGDTPRRLPEVAPEEIRNAMVECVRQGIEVREAEMFELVAKLFGHERQTDAVKQRLSAVALWSVDTRRLAQADDGSYRLA